MAIKTSNQITFMEQKKIINIKEWYLAIDKNSNITFDTAGWTEEIQTINEEKQYLWNYEEVIYSIGPSDKSTPVIIGFYGNGTDGKGILDIKNYYFVTRSHELPDNPIWSETVLTLTPENKYLWNYDEVIYTDGTSKVSPHAIIGVYGDSGSDAITFQIYSSQGFIFKEDMDQIELQVIAFKGADAITDATYTWSWLNNDSDMYTEIVSNSTESSIIINKTDDYALASLKCVMTYDDKTYEDYIMLSNETILYTSMVKFFDGNNIFSSNDLYIVAYVEMYRNNDREETISTTTYCSGVSTVSPTGEISSSLTGEFSDGDQIYFIYQNDNDLYEVVLGQYTSGVWNVVDNRLKYTYTNTLYPNINSNVLAISKESINKSQNIDFMIYKDGVHVSSASANVIDSNDPIVSNTTPKNPDYNQLWLDTSTVPYTLKIFTQVEGEEIGRWVDCSQQIGEAIHTSKPSIYKKGDLWILADNERCGDFGPGSMLKSTNNSDQFSETHWVDAASSLTATITNIRESFTWDERGIQIAKRVTASNGNITNPFYVHIDSTRMGFHSVTYKENGVQDRDVEVVHIGYNSATIQNATFEGSNGTTFDNDATFNKQINMNGIDKNGSSVGFVWKIETNGSLSLALSN